MHTAFSQTGKGLPRFVGTWRKNAADFLEKESFREEEDETVHHAQEKKKKKKKKKTAKKKKEFAQPR